MKFNLLFFLLFFQAMFAQEIKLQSVEFAWASKNDESGIYRDWKKCNQDFFINTQNKTINSANPKNGLIKILKQYKYVINKKGHKVIKFDCKDIDGTNCIVYFIKYSKPNQKVIGQVVLNFSVSNSIFIYNVKYKET